MKEDNNKISRFIYLYNKLKVQINVHNNNI
jgi:hypothetical protein